MADNRITVQRIKNHWRYSWWMYAIVAIVVAIGIDLLFSITAYRPPEDRKLQLYLCNGYANAQALAQDLWPELVAACPEQEELQGANIDLVTGDYYTQMQFTTYIAAREGDVCLLPLDQVRTLASDGAQNAFIDLAPYIERGVIPVEGIDLSPGTLADSDGVRSVYAIPADTLYGLYEYGCDPAGGLLCLMAYGGNDEAAATLLGQMIARFQTDPPDWADGLKAGQTQIFMQ